MMSEQLKDFIRKKGLNFPSMGVNKLRNPNGFLQFQKTGS